MAVFPLTPYHWAQHMATAFEFIGSFHVIILLIYHTYFIWSLTKKQNKQSLSLIQLASIFYLVTVVPYCIGVLLLSFGVQTSLGCKYFCDCVSSAIFVAKCICFIVFIEKLNVTFIGTIYAFQKSTIKTAKIIVFVWMLILLALVFISGESYYVEEHEICAGSYPLWAHATAILGDLIIGLMISTTFCRRLIKLQITLQNVSPNLSDATDIIKQSQQIADLMTKFTVLATFSIFTTLFTYVVIFIFELGSFWMIQDTMINSWCVILLFEGNFKIYNFMCGPMEKCCIASRLLSCCSCSCCCSVTPSVIKLPDDPNNTVEITTQAESDKEKADNTPNSTESVTDKP